MIILSHGGQLWGGNIPASCSPQHLTRLVITSGLRREKMSLRTSFFTVEITLVREVPTDWWSKSRDGAPSQGAALSVSPSDRTALFSLNEHWLDSGKWIKFILILSDSLLWIFLFLTFSFRFCLLSIKEEVLHFYYLIKEFSEVSVKIMEKNEKLNTFIKIIFIVKNVVAKMWKELAKNIFHHSNDSTFLLNSKQFRSTYYKLHR